MEKAQSVSMSSKYRRDSKDKKRTLTQGIKCHECSDFRHICVECPNYRKTSLFHQ
jgi:hypothetical protein